MIFSTRVWGAATAVVLCCSTSAMAGGINILDSPFRHPGAGGGEFTFQVVGGWLDTSAYSTSQETRNVGPNGVTASNNSFQTFCIETNEYINIPQAGYEGSLSDRAMLGGSGGQEPPGGDPVSRGTGWLYSQFARGTLANYAYNPAVGSPFTDRRNSALALQEAIWWLEGETAYAGVSNVFTTMVIAQFQSLGGAAYAKAGSGSEYGVKAINMTRVEGGVVVKKQDALFLVPDGGATLSLLGGALLTLGVVRRRLGR